MPAAFLGLNGFAVSMPTSFLAARFACLRRFCGYAVSMPTPFEGFAVSGFLIIVVVARNDSTLHLVVNLET